MAVKITCDSSVDLLKEFYEQNNDSFLRQLSCQAAHLDTHSGGKTEVLLQVAPLAELRASQRHQRKDQLDEVLWRYNPVAVAGRQVSRQSIREGLRLRGHPHSANRQVGHRRRY